MNVYPGYLPNSLPDKKSLPEYFCPVCGAQLGGGDVLAEDKDGDTVGCVYCIRYFETWEKDTNEHIIKRNRKSHRRNPWD